MPLHFTHTFKEREKCTFKCIKSFLIACLSNFQLDVIELTQTINTTCALNTLSTMIAFTILSLFMQTSRKLHPCQMLANLKHRTMSAVT
ncbi:unnamed protein product [Chironomus riparius]|uniref:Uncharacterized protein n=1 Tax=Chironomus riparius TaxID=315576 RepID=A0A9N9WVZ5_9DIPT|nr:unnamed protein product [Chironomus riparius]